MELDVISTRIEEIKKKLEVFNDPKFIFDPIPHTYKRGRVKFTSVTTKVSQFAIPFDEIAMSRKKALDAIMDNMNNDDLFDLEVDIDEKEVTRIQNELLESWHHERDIACELGTAVHLWMEEFFGNLPFTDIVYDDVLERVEKFKKFYASKLENKIFSVGQEIRVFNTKMKIAGTIDALFFRYHKGKLMLEIWDYKTNKVLHTDENKRYKKLLPPFQNEYENELNKYSIQLNIYKLILASVGIYVDGELVLVHIPSNGEPMIYRCKDYIQELEMYFGVNYYTKLKSSYQ